MPMLGNCPGHCTLPPTSTHSQPLPPSQAEQLCFVMENAPQNTRGGLNHSGLGLFLATLTASSREKCSEVSGFLCPVFGGAFCFCLQVLGLFLSSYQNGWGEVGGKEPSGRGTESSLQLSPTSLHSSPSILVSWAFMFFTGLGSKHRF